MSKIRSIIVVLVAVFVAGCAVVPATGPYTGHRIPYGYGTQMGGVQVAPCVPYRADALMAWATELESGYQTRSAHVTNQNGVVYCTTSESGGSQRTTGGRR